MATGNKWHWFLDGRKLGSHATRQAAISAAEKHYFSLSRSRRKGRALAVKHASNGCVWRYTGHWYQVSPPTVQDQPVRAVNTTAEGFAE